ncbi:MAG: hypothetical protein ACRECV_10340 [Xanthobacteraceae bacterium]
MSEQAGTGTGSTSQSAPVTVDAAAGAAAAPPAGAEAAIDRTRVAQSNPRAAGYRPPGADWRQAQQEGGQQQSADGQQQASAAPETFSIDGADYAADDVRAALKFKAEQDIRKSGLPASPDQYQLTLPADFKAPEGVKFEFDSNSAELQNFKRLAHARGLDQQTFSEALGIYAANRIGEQQQLGTARTAELAKLGSAAGNRIAAVETWLKSQVGARANLIVNQLKNFPVAGMVEMFEDLARNSSNQGSASYSQSGRQQEENQGKISGYEGMTFAQKRAAQDAQLGARVRLEGRGR